MYLCSEFDYLGVRPVRSRPQVPDGKEKQKSFQEHSKGIILIGWFDVIDDQIVKTDGEDGE